jgi:hypothetical protein
MRNKVIGFIILLIALSLLVLGIIEGQILLFSKFYQEMAEIE